MELLYHFPMNWQQVWGVLKWVLAALTAGFIGQFGKTLAIFLINRRRASKLPKDSLNQIGESAAAPKQSPSADSYRAKIEKKKAKAQVKRLKKS